MVHQPNWRRLCPRGRALGRVICTLSHEFPMVTYHVKGLDSLSYNDDDYNLLVLFFGVLRSWLALFYHINILESQTAMTP